MYVEWHRTLRTGTKRRQEASRTIESETRLFCWYEPVLVPGILHTAQYAAAVMRRVIEFYQIPDDLEAGVEVRMQRQQILYHGNHRFHFVLAEQALHTMVGDASVMSGQLDSLPGLLSLPRVCLGILPAAHRYRRVEVERRGRHRVARLAGADCTTRPGQARPDGAVDRAVDTTAAQKRLVRGRDDGVHVLPRDVTQSDLDRYHSSILAHQATTS